MKNKKGISLIVLIITIIVVIILAAAVILTMNNNNPISSAKEATFKSDVSSMQDELSMYTSKMYTDNQGNYELSELDLSGDDMVEKLPSTKKYKEKVKVEDGKLVWIGAENKTEDEKTDTDKAEENWFNNVVGNTTSSNNVPKQWKDHIASVTSENVPIPKGFTYVEGTRDTGVVIEDDIGNQFVWVPATEDTYIKDTSFTGVYATDTTDDLPSGIDETADVKKYGGFYIGRYEAGVPDNQTTIDGTNSTTSNVSGIPTSKKGKASWTNISYTNSKINAESMISNENVKTGLLTGKSGDTTCNWIKSKVSSLTDSTSYGNYMNNTFSYINLSNVSTEKSTSNIVKIPTGSTEYTKVNNIYDLAGNVWEWTTELFSSYNVFRGGFYFSKGNECPVSCRELSYDFDFDGGLGFRVRLYIM